MPLLTEPYLAQDARWPRRGRHVLAQFDAERVVVYQAYRPEIARYAVEHQRFGGGAFSFSRMSWVKPNFLWMMFRCGWATKEGQEHVLAVSIRRDAFDQVLAAAVHSGYEPAAYASEAAWRDAVMGSEVRLQWDPDHDPSCNKLERRAIQLGLRGEALRRYASEWVVAIEDVTDFVRAQRPHAPASGRASLVTPREDVYPVADRDVAARLGIDDPAA